MDGWNGLLLSRGANSVTASTAGFSPLFPGFPAFPGVIVAVSFNYAFVFIPPQSLRPFKHTQTQNVETVDVDIAPGLEYPKYIFFLLLFFFFGRSWPVKAAEK